MYQNTNKLKDCIRNTTAVCNPRHIQSETKFSLKKKISDHWGKNSQTEFCLGLHFVSDFQCTF